MKKRLSDRMADSFRTLNAAPVTLTGRSVSLRLPRGWPESDPSVYWWSGDGSGHVENLAQLPAAVRSAPVQVWTPAADTLLTQAKIPTRSRARILQALPYALEDQLLDEPEALHFAYVREAEGALAVAVTQRSRLNIWLEILKGAGIRPATLCPANLALPLQARAWSAAFVDGELWVRRSAYSGFVTLAATAAAPPLLVAAFKEAAAQGHAPDSLVVYGAPPDFSAESWSSALQVPVVAETVDFWLVATPPTLNLLQADFGHAAHLRQLARPLRPAIAMLAIWLVVTLAIDVAEWIRLRSSYRDYTAQMRTVFQQSFPEVKTVLDPAAQMQRQLEALQTRGGGPADLLPLLTQIAPTLKAQEANVKLHGLKYTERSLTIELALPNYQALDAMKNALQAANLDVEVLAANGRGNEVDGRLRVQPTGAGARPKQRS